MGGRYNHVYYTNIFIFRPEDSQRDN